jgi:hypothetical protein
MPQTPGTPPLPARRHLLVWIGAPLVILLLGGWVGRSWWGAVQCRALCTPQRGSARPQLAGGGTVALLREDVSDSTRYVDYVMQGDMRNWPRLCAEAWEVLRALDARGTLAPLR